jgi:hypothetical protein
LWCFGDDDDDDERQRNAIGFGTGVKRHPMREPNVKHSVQMYRTASKYVLRCTHPDISSCTANNDTRLDDSA